MAINTAEEPGMDETGVDIDATADESAEPMGQEQEPEAAGQAEEEEGEQILEVTYQTDEGDEITEELALSEIGNLVAAARSKYGGPDPNVQDVIQKAAPLLDDYNKSNLMQWVHYYAKQGETDEQIMRRLISESQKRGYEAPADEDENDPAVIRRRVQEEMVNPVKAEFEQFKAQQIQKEIQSNNQTVLTNALKNYGWDEAQMGKPELDKIIGTWSALYPGIDLQKYAMNQSQANIIIKNALGSKTAAPQTKVVSKAASAIKNSSAPKVIPGTKGMGGGPPKLPGEEKPKVMSLTERINAKHKLFGAGNGQ